MNSKTEVSHDRLDSADRRISLDSGSKAKRKLWASWLPGVATGDRTNNGSPMWYPDDEEITTPFMRSERDYEMWLASEKAEFKERVQNSPQIKGDLSDFTALQQLGKGSFGKVLLVQHADTRKAYAMKILSQRVIHEKSLTEYVIREKSTLYAVKNPFIVTLHYHYKNDTHLYLLMDFVACGDVEFHLFKLGKFKESMTKFYAAQVVLAFEYLHTMKLVYRDLKPNNLVIDRNGYLKIIDFGLVKCVLERTHTLVGCPHYFAPELILSKGYNKAIDWWTLGILIYEMMCGSTPFHDENKLTMYAKIHSGKFSFPKHFSSPLKDLLTKLLLVDSTKRLGNLENGSIEVKKHPWFSDMNWLDLFNKKVKPPWCPEIADRADTRYFPRDPNENLSFNESEDGNSKESVAYLFDEF